MVVNGVLEYLEGGSFVQQSWLFFQQFGFSQAIGEDFTYLGALYIKDWFAGDQCEVNAGNNVGQQGVDRRPEHSLGPVPFYGISK